MVARSALREMRNLTSHLEDHGLPAPPDWSSHADRRLVEDWKRYLAWEESNPLELQDAAALYQRVEFAYRKAMMHMRFYPEIW
jgi:cleavage stimulation factor subunit 3